MPWKRDSKWRNVQPRYDQIGCDFGKVCCRCISAFVELVYILKIWSFGHAGGRICWHIREEIEETANEEFLPVSYGISGKDGPSFYCFLVFFFPYNSYVTWLNWRIVTIYLPFSLFTRVFLWSIWGMSMVTQKEETTTLIAMTIM